MKKICFIGGGNMASAMLAGLVKAYPNIERHVIEPFAETRERIAASGAYVHASPVREAVVNADAVVLASIALWLSGKTSRIVRTMPNTPALVGKGITGVFAPPTLSANDVETAMTLMRSCGEVLRVDDEAMIDAVTAVSGSGPAYVFHWIESMIDAAKGVGFSDAAARTLVLATLKGATALAEASTESPATLRERVTSKGGTTAAALAVIDERGVKTALIDAVSAARDRGRALGKPTEKLS
jgi:pyrroline-5-carboxylate reductase